MAVTYGLAGSSPFNDFATDLENIVIQYIYDRWSFISPSQLAKPAAMHGEGQNIEFRSGFDRGAPSFQVLCVQTSTDVVEQTSARRSWHFVTRLEVTVITNIMDDIDNVKAELGQMEREVQRILNQYKLGDISGIPITEMMFSGQARIYDDIISGANSNPQVRGNSGGRGSSGGVSWATSRWKTRLYAECHYYKDDIS